MEATELAEIVGRLRSTGSDWENVEAKRASGGTPESLDETLGALANHPGGGIIVLGLDETTGFSTVRLDNINTLKQALSSKARLFQPPIGLEIEDGTVDGSTVVVVNVRECPVAQKPCKDSRSGKAWVRSYDGDFEISDLEEQAFLVARQAPSADKDPVKGATKEHLDPQLTDRWAESAVRNRVGLRQFTDRDELLRRTGVITQSDVPTVAGIMTLGKYPQEFFPQVVIRAASTDDGSSGARATNAVTFDGPIPVMLESAMRWAQDNFQTVTVESERGDVFDRPEYPLIAFRELIANALVHRDYSEWSRGQAIEVRRISSGLVIANPGGLYGVTVDRLGIDSVTSARNQWIVSLCQDALQPSGARIIEALASGIPRVVESLAAAGQPPPRYWDTGIKFTVRLERGSVEDRTRPRDARPPTRSLTNIERVFDQLVRSSSELEVFELAEKTELSQDAVRTALKSLKKENRVKSSGGRGKRTKYSVID